MDEGRMKAAEGRARGTGVGKTFQSVSGLFRLGDVQIHQRDARGNPRRDPASAEDATKLPFNWRGLNGCAKLSIDRGSLGDGATRSSFGRGLPSTTGHGLCHLFIWR
jgi:hypothetical protein